MKEAFSGYLTINDLSIYLGIKPKTLYARIKEIPHYKVGRLSGSGRKTWMPGWRSTRWSRRDKHCLPQKMAQDTSRRSQKRENLEGEG